MKNIQKKIIKNHIKKKSARIAQNLRDQGIKEEKEYKEEGIEYYIGESAWPYIQKYG